MRNLIAVATGAALLVGGAGSAALAGPGDGYPGSIRTSTSVSGPSHSRAGDTETYTARLGVASSGRPCDGRFDLKVTKGDSTVQEDSKGTGGASRSFGVTFDQGRGKYVVKVRFVPVDNSPCKGSHDDKTVKVKKSKR